MVLQRSAVGLSVAAILLSVGPSLGQAAQTAAVPPGLPILFQTDRAGTSDIYAMDALGKRQVPVVATAADDEDPDWAPDGGFAFSSDRDNTWQIYAVDAGGGPPRQLTRGRFSSVDPIYAPDGSKIAFESDRTGNWEIWVMNADGSSPQNMSKSRTTIDLDPNWSADSSRVVFDRIAKPGSFVSSLYEVNTATGGVRRLTAGTARAKLEPAYSPRDGRLAFVGFENRNYNLFVRDAGGKRVTRLTSGAPSELDPAWSPNAQTIAFTSGALNHDLEIMSVPATGGKPRNLSHNHTANDSEPDWRATTARGPFSAEPTSPLNHGPVFQCGGASNLVWGVWHVRAGNVSENRLCGYSGKDWLRGFDAWDRLQGYQGVDRFEGGGGGDWFKSHDSETDTLYGGQLTLNASHGIVSHSDTNATDEAWPDKPGDNFYGINKLNP